MADPISDIKKYIKSCGLFDKKTTTFYQKIIKSIEDYEYEYEYVNAPAAMGDTHKSSCSYSINGFNFDYHHINGDGGIFSAEFTIEHNDEKETILQYSEMAEMAKRFRKNLGGYPKQQTGLLNKFMGGYSEPDENDIYHNLLAILNAFTFGQCATISQGKITLMAFDFE